MPACHVLRLGRIAYQEALDLQHQIVERIKETETRDAVLLLLEHEAVVTLGRSADAANLLLSREEFARRGIELHESSRGGDVTYHGPGQIVGYPILRLAGARRDVHRYLRSVEQVIINVLARYGLQGRRVEGYTGVWVEDAKVAAIGVALTRWVTYHGFALNVATDLDAFRLIVPCGITDKPVTSLEKLLGRSVPLREVEDALAEEFVAEFGFETVVRQDSRTDLPPDLH
jgi:lipoate-protein ligase B